MLKGRAKRSRPARKKQQSFPARLWKWIRWVLAGAAGLLSAGAIALAYFAYYPRVFVDPPSTSTDPAHPFSEPFRLTNIGAISIYSVRVDCGPPLGLEFAFTTGPQEVESGEKFDFKGDVKENVFSIDKLVPNERHPVPCSGITPESNSMISSKGRTFVVKQADIQINVHFKLAPFIPKDFVNNFPFLGTLQKDGAIHWSEAPLMEAAPSLPSQ
jgi:hypothetical protein